MRKIHLYPDDFTDEQKYWWKEWIKEAADKTDEIIDKFESNDKLVSDDFNNDVWGKLKKWALLNIFENKCGYCETKKIRTQFDAEHFRPKGAVKYRNDAGELKTSTCNLPDGRESKHPGYFWLAYNWKNLLPSCKYCNAGEGKLNQFPTLNKHVFLKKLSDQELGQLINKPIESKKWTSYFYLSPDDLDNLEDRLLLHPIFDEPTKHLKFGEKGMVVAKSKMGENSIIVYNLKEDKLNEERHSAQFSLRNRFFALMAAKGEDYPDLDLSQLKKKIIEELESKIKNEPKREYISAQLDYLHYILSNSF